MVLGEREKENSIGFTLSLFPTSTRGLMCADFTNIVRNTFMGKKII
jgi:hypothetical protein